MYPEKPYVVNETKAGIEISVGGIVYDYFVGEIGTTLDFTNSAVVIKADAIQPIADIHDMGLVIDNLEISARVEDIEPGAFSIIEGIEGSIIISEGNNHYKSEDDVIFTKDGKKLIYCSISKDDDEYEVPNGVEEIVNEAFCFSRIQTIVIPPSVTTIHPEAFYDSYIETIVGEAGSVAEEFAEEEGFDFEEM